MNSKLNRLRATKAALLNMNQQQGKSERKARTRTLIQVGALVKMIGLFELSGVTEGMDLQSDLEHQDKAATLLGLLLEAYDELPPEPSSEQVECWRNKGIQYMKSHQSKKYF